MSAGTPYRARKRFGQHFLHDRAVVRRIVQAIAPRPGDTMVEIGPGTGVLTEALLDALPTLHAVEIDRDLAGSLAARLGPRGLQLHVGDALELDLARLAPAPRTLRVVGNLPYNISTPLLFHLLAHRAALRDMHFMLQREVVTRMAAAPGGGDYGRLSVMVQLSCLVEPLFRVGPGAFTPAPRVDSAVVRLLPRDVLPVATGQLPAFESLVARAFSKRRKTLRNALLGALDADAIEAAGVDPGRRAETLALEEFVALARAYARSGG